jgi:hypothetical protein
MRRLVWVSIGAAGGIMAYRKAHELLATAKEKGVLLTVTDTTTSLKDFAQGASDHISRLRDPASQPQGLSGSAAASVLSNNRR